MRVLAVACGVLATQVGGARITRKNRRVAQHHPGEDTFDHEDDQATKQMDQGQDARMETISGEDTPSAFSTPIMAGSGPKCATNPMGQRVVSVADQHGDFDGMVRHLNLLGLLSRVPNKNPSSWRSIWAGGDAIFVQTGDILDRGPDGKVMYEFLWVLQDQAPKGSVVLLTGNHELMVLQGDIRYVTNIDFCAYTSDNCGGRPPSSAAYCDNCCNYANGNCKNGGSGCMKGNCEFLQSWDQNGEMGKEMRRRFKDGRMKLVYQANGVVFTHAGLANSIWDKIGTRGSGAIDRLNNLTAELFNSKNGRSLYYSNSVIAAGSRQNGPMWTRICYDSWYTQGARRRSTGGKAYIDDDELRRVAGDRCTTIGQSLADIGARRMVIGHCPQGSSSRSSGIRTSCSGQFIEADTYMSIAYAGSRSNANYNMAAMEFYSADPKAKVWVVYSGRNRCQELASPGAVSPSPSPSPPRRRAAVEDRRRRRRRV